MKLLKAQSPLIRKVMYSGVIRFLSVAATFGYFLTAARATSSVEFGLFSVAYVTASILSYCATGGQHVTVLRFWPSVDEIHGRNVAAQVLKRTFLICIATCITVSAAFASLAVLPPLSPLYGGSVRYIFVIATLIFLLGISEYLACALRAQGYLWIALFPRDVLWRVASSILFLTTPQKLDASGMIIMTSAVLAAVIAPQIAYLTYRIVSTAKEDLPAEDALAMRRGSLAFWGGATAAPVIEQSATLVISALLGPAAAAAYFSADRLAKLMLVARVGIDQVVGPQISRAYKAQRKDELRSIVYAASVAGGASGLTAFVAAVFFGKTALSVFNPDFASAYAVLLILCFGQLINTMMGSNAVLLNMTGSERALLALRAVFGVTLVVGVYCLTRGWGDIGAAFMSSAVLISWNIAASYVCGKRLGILPWYVVKIKSILDRIAGASR
ncbi:lipopolysaccharide biosynthesis protein [Rhizobium glycinendophyticum]|uniref:Lipopolysaccharide biosynthesis protein n=1 Tax=Rhizobium glycinendophyticum TaxID=2589807 RepID=A0A504UG30_9HYPH|nr:lipopolysaccharide biosynthesis protein [Rhizobium glycinendophyticum]TPP03923.1 lipopolysaccharide biosynthesis protein [Rhizobium glycinendophyticum]